jgi:hypothetical protein
MNERIRELAEQAGSTHKQNLGVYQFYTDELEKFAELIVRECLVPLWSIECMQSDLALEEYNRNAAKIKQHFGVEE